MKSRRRPMRFRKGDHVRVRSAEQILATLDATGKLDGLPFMPEMTQFCGRVFRVFRRADKVFHDRYYYVGRLKQAVLLQGVRCDGQSHGRCSMACLMLWKEAWLEPAEPPAEQGPVPAAEAEPVHLAEAEPVRAGPAFAQLTTMKDGKYCCQATELTGATTRLRWWDLRQYVRDLVYGEASPGQLARELWLSAYNRIGRMRGWKAYGSLSGRVGKTASADLNLQPGELVEVKSREEIEATLDADGKNRGLAFAPEMSAYCGRRFPVARRVDRIILEWSGEMRSLTSTVMLEGVLCRGLGYRRCPRSCHHLWREAWLKRASQKGTGTVAGDRIGRDT